ncbi:MAG: FtsX-like permease family protein [Vicinamibacterales bacterium]
MLARLAPGVTIDRALAEMRVLDRFRIDDFARTRSQAFARDFSIELEPAAAGFSALRDRVGSPLLVLMVVVALLLLIACTNVASLLLARAAARQHELALRVSLGAGRMRLVRHVMMEALLLAGVAGVIGTALAWAGAGLLVRVMTSGREFARFAQHVNIPAQPDAAILAFTAAITALTALVFGAAPAWRAASAAPVSALRVHTPSGVDRTRRRFGQALVVIQVALSIVLLGTATLFVRHLSLLRSEDVGLERGPVLLVRLDPSRSGLSGDALFAPYRNLLERLEAIPEVRSASVSAITPLTGAGASRFVRVEGFEEPEAERRFVPLNWVGPRYFETFGTPLTSGREFSPADAAGPPVAIVNQAMARHYFPDRSPIGGRVQLVGPSNSGVAGAPADRVYEVVGVVADARYLDLRDPPPPTIYLNAFQVPRMSAHRFALRTAGRPGAVASEVRRIVREELPTIPIAEVTTMDAIVEASIVPERMVAGLSSAFGGLGALLAALGLYGLLAYMVARRTNEIGIRMSLGATRGDIARLVIGGAAGLLCAGAIVGVPLAVLGRRLASQFVPGLPVEQAWPLVVATVAMLVIGLLATWGPCHRAASVHPVEALRS